MKKIFYLLMGLVAALSFTACSDDDENGYATYPVEIQLQYPDGLVPQEGVLVSLKNTASDLVSTAPTDAKGVASFQLPAGLYEASATQELSQDNDYYILNGLNSAVKCDGQTVTVPLQLTASKSSPIVIKEFYFGGCLQNDGQKSFYNDKYVVLYNNSNVTVDLQDYGFTMLMPYNATGTNKDYVDGKLFYEATQTLPVAAGAWYFEPGTPVQLEPGKQLVVAINGAVDHTQTYTNSVDLSKGEYYCMYDMDQFNMESMYPAPSAAIPANHQLKCIEFGLGKAWPLSQISPAFVVFKQDHASLTQFVESTETENLYGKLRRKMMPVSWIVDGIEVFKQGATNNQKRLLSTVDAGYLDFTNGKGYTAYRNVNKAATEALAENAGKLVYDYAGAVMDTKDPSGIDAEASLAKGARIIYADTNNSTNDFHQRGISSLK